jgi:hypothetical protein
VSEITDLITAVVAACSVAGGLVGGSIAFVWGKVEKRFLEIEGELRKCKKREDRGQERRSRQLIVIELLWQEIQRLAPGPLPPVLLRAKRLLDELKTSDDEPIEREER